MGGVLGRWKCVSKEALLLHNPHESRKFKRRRKKNFLAIQAIPKVCSQERNRYGT